MEARFRPNCNLVNPVNPVKNAYPVTNAWNVSFAYHRGISAAPPAPVTMETLRDWTTFGEDGKTESTSLRYFSGTATYRTTFLINEEGIVEKVFLPKEIKTKTHAEQILKAIEG